MNVADFDLSQDIASRAPFICLNVRADILRIFSGRTCATNRGDDNFLNQDAHSKGVYSAVRICPNGASKGSDVHGGSDAGAGFRYSSLGHSSAESLSIIISAGAILEAPHGGIDALSDRVTASQ